MIITVASFKGGETLIERGVPGIYSIHNTENDKRYVGSAISIYDRLYNHIWHLEQGTHRNQRLLNAWRKYGMSAFVLKVIEVISDPLQLLEREQHWIDHYDSHQRGYNINPKAGNNLGRKFDSEARRNIANGARLAMSDPAVKERLRQATRAAMSRPEVRKKCREAMLQRRADPSRKAKLIESLWSEDARKKRQQTWLRKSQPKPKKEVIGPGGSKRYQIIWPDGRTERIANLKSFCWQHGLPYPSAMNVLNGRVKTVRGVIIRKEMSPLS
jgi:group I intron endonuclease